MEFAKSSQQRDIFSWLQMREKKLKILEFLRDFRFYASRINFVANN